MIALDKEKNYYYPTKINDSLYFSAFGTKTFKASEDLKVVKEFCRNNTIEAKYVYNPNQVHSVKVKVLNYENITQLEDGDGVITNKSNIALVVRTADCVPILFLDKKTGFIGISHQGWKGSVNGMVEKMIHQFKQNNSKIQDIQIAIGPSINGCCFEVQDDVYFEFKNKQPKHFSKITQIRKGKKYIHLLQLNYLLLRDAGIKKEMIEFFPFCTMCNNEQFFSYRRDYKTNYNNFGQQLSFIIKQ